MIDSIARLLRKLLTLLPKFDTGKYVNSIQKVLKPFAGYLNFVIPIGDMYDLLVLWSKCMTAYFVYVTVKPLIMKVIERIIEKGITK